MFNHYALGVLRDEAAAGGEAGGGAAGSGAAAGQGAPAFDPAAFETKLTGSMQSMFNKFDKKLTDQSKTITELQQKLNASGGSSTGTGEGSGTGEGPGTNGQASGTKGLPPEVATELKTLRTKLATLENAHGEETKRREAAENASRETSRVTNIKDVLNGIKFRDQTTREDAFHMVASRVKYNEDGELVATVDGQDITAKAFIEGYFNDKSRTHYLAPLGNSGSGARSAGATNGGFNPTTFLSADQVSKLTPEQKSSYLKNLAEVAGQR